MDEPLPSPIGHRNDAMRPDPRRELGFQFTEQAKAFDADLLVMGTYSHSPFRESLTGGVTNYLLSHAELPLLMTH